MAPIGELYKSQIFELAKWRNEQGQVLPMEVIIRAPSAELSANQKDEDTLPPYKVLDKILELYLDRHLSAAEIATEGYDAVTTRNGLLKDTSHKHLNANNCRRQSSSSF